MHVTDIVEKWEGSGWKQREGEGEGETLNCRTWSGPINSLEKTISGLRPSVVVIEIAG